MTIIHLDYPVSINGRARYVSGGQIRKSKRASEWAKLAAWDAKASGVKVTGPFVLFLTAWAPDKRRRDLDNIIKPVLDALQAGGVIENDCMCRCMMAIWAGENAIAIEGKGDLPIIFVEVGRKT